MNNNFFGGINDTNGNLTYIEEAWLFIIPKPHITNISVHVAFGPPIGNPCQSIGANLPDLNETVPHLAIYKRNGLKECFRLSLNTYFVPPDYSICRGAFPVAAKPIF